MTTEMFRDRLYDLPPGPSEPVLKRTWSTGNPGEFAISKKRGLPVPEAVREAVDIVARHFPAERGPSGFMG